MAQFVEDASRLRLKELGAYKTKAVLEPDKPIQADKI